LTRSFKKHSFTPTLLVALACYSLTCCTPRAPHPVATRLIEQQYGVLKDPLVERYLEGILVRLNAAVASRRQSIVPKLTLLSTSTVVALAPDEDTILISQGMLRTLANEAELAFVLAHERAHQQLGHTALDVDEVSASKRKSLELAADQRAIAVMAAAGYDPRAAFGALKRTDVQDSQGLTNRADYPDLEEREKAALSFLSGSGWLPPGTVNRRDFVMVQRHLADANRQGR